MAAKNEHSPSDGLSAQHFRQRYWRLFLENLALAEESARNPTDPLHAAIQSELSLFLEESCDAYQNHSAETFDQYRNKQLTSEEFAQFETRLKQRLALLIALLNNGSGLLEVDPKGEKYRRFARKVLGVIEEERKDISLLERKAQQSDLPSSQNLAEPVGVLPTEGELFQVTWEDTVPVTEQSREANQLSKECQRGLNFVVVNKQGDYKILTGTAEEILEKLLASIPEEIKKKLGKGNLYNCILAIAGSPVEMGRLPPYLAIAFSRQPDQTVVVSSISGNNRTEFIYNEQNKTLTCSYYALLKVAGSDEYASSEYASTVFDAHVVHSLITLCLDAACTGLEVADRQLSVQRKFVLECDLGAVGSLLSPDAAKKMMSFPLLWELVMADEKAVSGWNKAPEASADTSSNGKEQRLPFPEEKKAYLASVLDSGKEQGDPLMPDTCKFSYQHVGPSKLSKKVVVTAEPGKRGESLISPLKRHYFRWRQVIASFDRQKHPALSLSNKLLLLYSEHWLQFSYQERKEFLNIISSLFQVVEETCSDGKISALLKELLTVVEQEDQYQQRLMALSPTRYTANIDYGRANAAAKQKFISNKTESFNDIQGILQGKLGINWDGLREMFGGSQQDRADAFQAKKQYVKQFASRDISLVDYVSANRKSFSAAADPNDTLQKTFVTVFEKLIPYRALDFEDYHAYLYLVQAPNAPQIDMEMVVRSQKLGNAWLKKVLKQLRLSITKAQLSDEILAGSLKNLKDALDANNTALQNARNCLRFAGLPAGCPADVKTNIQHFCDVADKLFWHSIHLNSASEQNLEKQIKSHFWERGRFYSQHPAAVKHVRYFMEKTISDLLALKETLDARPTKHIGYRTKLASKLIDEFLDLTCDKSKQPWELKENPFENVSIEDFDTVRYLLKQIQQNAGSARGKESKELHDILEKSGLKACDPQSVNSAKRSWRFLHSLSASKQGSGKAITEQVRDEIYNAKGFFGKLAWWFGFGRPSGPTLEEMIPVDLEVNCFIDAHYTLTFAGSNAPTFEAVAENSVFPKNAVTEKEETQQLFRSIVGGSAPSRYQSLARRCAPLLKGLGEKAEILESARRSRRSDSDPAAVSSGNPGAASRNEPAALRVKPLLSEAAVKGTDFEGKAEESRKGSLSSTGSRVSLGGAPASECGDESGSSVAPLLSEVAVKGTDSKGKVEESRKGSLSSTGSRVSLGGRPISERGDESGSSVAPFEDALEPKGKQPVSLFFADQVEGAANFKGLAEHDLETGSYPQTPIC